LNTLRVKIRQLFNTGKQSGNWDKYKIALPRYSEDIRKAKQSSWRKFYQGNEDVSDSTRLMKIMAKLQSIRLTQ